MESRPRESWPADPVSRCSQADHSSLLDRGPRQGYTNRIYSPADQPSGLRRGFVFWNRLPVAYPLPAHPMRTERPDLMELGYGV